MLQLPEDRQSREAGQGKGAQQSRGSWQEIRDQGQYHSVLSDLLLCYPMGFLNAFVHSSSLVYKEQECRISLR